MIKKGIKTNTLKQIKRLKKDLMQRSYSYAQTRSNHSNSSSHTRTNRSQSARISLEFNKIKNAEIGEIFERNIRETLMLEYNFEQGEIKRHFFIRKLAINEKEEIFIIDEPKDLMINNEKYLLLFNNDKSLIVKKDSGQIFQTTLTNIKTNLSIDGENVEIDKLTEIEFDGSFIFNGSEFGFNKDEVTILFTNVNDEEISSYNYIILEIKLSITKISDLIAQLLRDKKIVEKIYNKKFLYVGFINSKELDYDISSIIGDLNIVIFGLKKNVFASRDMRKFYDWKTIHKVKLLNNDVDEMKTKISQMETQIGKMETQIGKMETQIGKMETQIAEMKGEMETQMGKMDNKIDLIARQISLLVENKKPIKKRKRTRTKLLGFKKGRGKIKDEGEDEYQKK